MYQSNHSVSLIQRSKTAICVAFLLFSTLLLATPRQAVAWDWSWGKSVTPSGNVKTETRAITGFNGIGLSLPANVTVRQGNKEGITIETDDNFLPLIETVVERNINFRGKFKMNIVIEVINIDHLSIAGSGDILAEQLRSPKLKASIAGSGDIKIKSLASNELKVSISGSGDFNAAGSAEEIEVSIAGSGDVKADKLKAKSAKVSIAGSGGVGLWATDAIKISIAGSGDIRYFGDPTITKSVAGSGNIKRMGASPQ